eukprot:TRINITY_DN11999_c0_g1_i1.p1 TRINITY_DN11999_c0_g1~~TRINITY_DN11999_c0_g1_i1.p1  ORF type:complete len:272 (-),score=54.53 TRINITY_DN11999_c0_g1_i1:57-836(-)
MEEEVTLGEIFAEPQDYFQKPPEPTEERYQRKNTDESTIKKEFVLRLLGKHPLWGHMLWNACIVMSDYLDDKNNIDLRGKSVIEFGAGTGLPCMIALINEAKHVVITDYPDEDLMQNIVDNVQHNLPESISQGTVKIMGHLWGKEPELLTDTLEKMGGPKKFDYIILSDLIFNHNFQTELLQSCSHCLADDGKIFVSFSHHRPKYAHRDLAFFENATQNFGLKCEKIFSKKIKPMFEVDEGPEDIRATVHFYILTKSKE